MKRNLIPKKYHYFLWSLLAHLLLILYTYFFGVWYLLFGLLIGLFLHNLTASLYIHRILSHNYHTISDNTHFILSRLHPLLNIGTLVVNASVHPYHHKYADKPKDPTDWRRLGVWNAFIKNYDGSYTLDRKFFVKLMKNEHIKWEYKHNKKIGKLAIFIFPFFPVAGFWLCNFLIFLVHLGKDLGNTAEDVWYFWPIMWGEEWHRTHHDKPELKQYHKLDMIYYMGKIIEIKEKQL